MKKGQIEKIKNIVSTETHYRVHCNIKTKIKNFLSSLVIFPNLSFHCQFNCVDDSSTHPKPS